MAKIYMMTSDGNIQEMSRIHCINEDLELQSILEKNPDLLPGDQINPDDARRWLVIKREMPVPDPSTGSNRWSIDFFFVDQDAMPTFVECKRYNDTRARREVVGQMLEYAANGHHYWSKEEMRDYAEQSASASGTTLEDKIRELQQGESDSVDDFFQRVEDNLREGQIRLVFFMEEAPVELKSLVDFLNKQMERSEVLLVEARQYQQNDIRIVVPMLFGYTEEARKVKKTISVTTGTSVQKRKKWNEESFFQVVQGRLTAKQVDSVKLVFDKVQELNCELRWGTGAENGSFSAKWPHLGNSIFSLYSSGTLQINFPYLNRPETITYLKDKLVSDLSFVVPDDYEKRYPWYPIEKWSDKADKFIEIIESLLQQYPPV